MRYRVNGPVSPARPAPEKAAGNKAAFGAIQRDPEPFNALALNFRCRYVGPIVRGAKASGRSWKEILGDDSKTVAMASGTRSPHRRLHGRHRGWPLQRAGRQAGLHADLLRLR